MTTPNTLANAIIRNIMRFHGLREVKPNAEWDDPKTPGPDTALSKELRELMRPVPWEEGLAYCIALCEGVTVKALRECGRNPKPFADLCMAGVVKTAERFREAGCLMDDPAPGSIWLAELLRTGKGHAGIVVTLPAPITMLTEEGNTKNDQDPIVAAKEREGDWITSKVRHRRTNGSFRTLGFITPSVMLAMCPEL